MDPSDIPDHELVARVAQGDEAAAAEVHRRYVRAVLALALRGRADREEAERATLEALVVLHREAPGFDGDDAERWLYERTRHVLGQAGDEPSAWSSWRAHRAYAGLAEAERSVVELAYWGGLSRREIATFLGSDDEAVAGLARHALGRVADRLDAPPGRPDARLDELLGVVDEAERDRLAAAHALLLEAVSPPELSPALEASPASAATPSGSWPSRYRTTLVFAAVLGALLLFGIGWLVGAAGETRTQAFAVPLAASGAASGELVVFRADDEGNWPLELSVEGLEPSRPGAPYELWTTRDGALVERVGSFAASVDGASVSFNVPFSPSSVGGWAVVAAGSDEPVLQTLSR